MDRYGQAHKCSGSTSAGPMRLVSLGAGKRGHSRGERSKGGNRGRHPRAGPSILSTRPSRQAFWVKPWLIKCPREDISNKMGPAWVVSAKFQKTRMGAISAKKQSNHTTNSLDPTHSHTILAVPRSRIRKSVFGPCIRVTTWPRS